MVPVRLGRQAPARSPIDPDFMFDAMSDDSVEVAAFGARDEPGVIVDAFTLYEQLVDLGVVRARGTDLFFEVLVRALLMALLGFRLWRLRGLFSLAAAGSLPVGVLRGLCILLPRLGGVPRRAGILTQVTGISSS